MIASFPGRLFQFWMFRVGHGEMLVRSPRDADHDENIDLIFAAVDFVDLPKILRGVQLDAPTPHEIQWLEERVGRPVDARQVTVLQTEGRRYFVVAAFFKVEHNHLGLYDLPFD